MRDRRLGESPFRHLEAENTTTDRRHDRRELDAGELRRVLEAARDSARPFRGLTGPDRYHLYATACGTGFRASALASLTPGELRPGRPTADRHPGGPARQEPQDEGAAAPRRTWPSCCATTWPTSRPGNPSGAGRGRRTTAGPRCCAIDLEAAGIPYAVEGPDGPLFADFHALRHSYLTLGGRAGIDLRTLQELAGHSTPVLTARYSHRRLHDLAGAVEKLPSFLPTTETGSEAVALRPTGTDASTFVDGVTRRVARTCGQRMRAARWYLDDDGPETPLPSTCRNPLCYR